MHRLVYICDWLPPDFGAVGQYAVQFATERASKGEDVVLAGLSSSQGGATYDAVGDGRLTTIRLHRPTYDRANFRERARWTLETNLRLLAGIAPHLAKADEVLITGSPPFMVHLLAPLRMLTRGKTLTYRITDFHPECLMAEMDKVPLPLQAFYQLTVFWRRQVDKFEALGEDQRQRLMDIGIDRDAIVIKRDPSPVTFAGDEQPLERPESLRGRAVLMYSGNWGVAHDVDTFIKGYRRHHRQGSGRVGLWLNATGAKADAVHEQLQAEGLPVHRGYPVPLEQLTNLLVTPDAHLITLLDPFVGYVLPSKVYGCAQSGKPILYIGSERSDVHLISRQAREADGGYFRVDVGDSGGVERALEQLADRTLGAQPVRQGKAAS